MISCAVEIADPAQPEILEKSSPMPGFPLARLSGLKTKIGTVAI
jgi:hypothetical protein